MGCQGIERFGQRFVRGVFRFLSQRGGGNQAKRCKSNLRLPLVSVGARAEVLNYFCHRRQPVLRRNRHDLVRVGVQPIDLSRSS